MTRAARGLHRAGSTIIVLIFGTARTPQGKPDPCLGASANIFGFELRTPDFLFTNVNIAIPTPWTGTLFGWSGTASIDAYGNWYWSPAGGGIGKSATFVSGSVTANWMNQAARPSEAQLDNMLSGLGTNATAGYVAGASESYTPGTGTASGVGVMSPQAGASANYSFHGGSICRKH